ncbi:MAG: trypsin-like serine protease [Methylococcales bacterium]|nr:trypsin-like serine protease [Methylococcales bacterium]
MNTSYLFPMVYFYHHANATQLFASFRRAPSTIERGSLKDARLSQRSGVILLLFIALLFTHPIHATENPIQAKIHNGLLSSTQEWPWMVILANKGSSDLRCGGTLIAKNWVLTAAHCVFDANTNQPLSANLFDILLNRSALNSTSGERIAIDRIEVHHSFFTTESMDGDIALIKLSKSSNLEPLELLSEFNDQDSAGNIATALGWGMTSSYRQASNNLQKVELPIVSNSDCQKQYLFLPFKIINSMVCAGFQNGDKDTCPGDSGGPLMVLNPARGTWQQVGITSFSNSRDCGSIYRTYGVFTRTKNYKPYISDKICSAQEVPVIPIVQKNINGHVVSLTWNRSRLAGTRYLITYQAYDEATPHSLEMNDRTDFSIDLPANSHYYVWVNAYKGNCVSPYTDKDHIDIV